ncbi:unnamed protein product [Schistosoma turkestanicum]|nr:unnamed protein product [Schistosoma turkestanicum]
MYERHKIALRNLKNANLLGIKIHDLVYYQNILTICTERVSHLPDVYEQMLLELIQLCNKSFLKTLSSDETNYFEIAVNFWNHFGYILQLKNIELCTAVCCALEQFYFRENQLNNDLAEEYKVQPTTKKFNQKVVCHSDIIESLLKCYCELDQSENLYSTLLRLMDKLTKHSEICSNKIVSKLGAQFICNRLALPILSNEMISRSISILWNLIDNITNDTMKIDWVKQIGSEDCLLKLRDIFFTLLAQSHSKFCRHLRNDVLTIILLIVKYANIYGLLKEIHIVQSGLIRRLVHLLTFDEFKCMNPLFKNLKLLPNDENFDMKRLIISIFVELCHDSSAIYTMSTSGLIKSLFQWICPIIQPNSPQYEQMKIEQKPNQQTQLFNATEYTTVTNTSNIISPCLPAKNCNSIASENNATVECDNNQNNSNNRSQTLSVNKLSENVNLKKDNLKMKQKSLSNPTMKQQSFDLYQYPNNQYSSGNKQEIDFLCKWPQAYLEELHLYMLDSLTTLAPYLLNDCVTYGIPSRLIILLQWCISPEPFLGQGNSFHGVGGRNSKRAQLRYSLRLVRCLIESNDERIITEFVCQGLIQFLVPLICPISSRVKLERPHDELFKFANQTFHEKHRARETTDQTIETEYQHYLKQSQDSMEEDLVGLEMQCDILLILSKLCNKEVERKQMIGTEGINAINLLIKQLSKRFAIIDFVQYRLMIQSNQNPIEHLSNQWIILHREPLIKLAYALIEAVWGCIIGSNDCEDYFLLKNGATHLLYLLEWYPLESINQLLGCLVDLTENPKCLPYLSCWSGIHPLNNDDEDGEEENRLALNYHPNMNHNNRMKQQLSHLELTTSLLIKSPDLAVSTRLHKIIANTNKHTITHRDNNDNNNNNQVHSSMSNDQDIKSLDTFKQNSINPCKTDEVDPDAADAAADDDDDADAEDDEEESVNIWLNGPGLAQLLCYIWRWDEKRLKQIESQQKQCHQELLTCISEWCKKQTVNVQCQQQKILNSIQAAELRKEQQYYSSIRKIIRNHEYAMENYHDYLARTSNYAYLKEAHQKQLSLINASRIGQLNDSKKSSTDTNVQFKNQLSKCKSHDKGYSVYHKTDIDKLNVTAFCSQTIHIDSTPKHLFQHPNELEKELIELVETREQSQLNNTDSSSDDDDDDEKRD